MASDIIATSPINRPMAQWGFTYVAAEDHEDGRAIITSCYEALDAHRDEIAQLIGGISQALPRMPLDPDLWQRCRNGIVSVDRIRGPHGFT